MIISEMPSGIWTFNYRDMPINRTGVTVKEYLENQDIQWVYGNHPKADFRVYKDENKGNGLFSIRRLNYEYQKRYQNVPYLNLNGEAQEHSWLSYRIADPEKTYSVAPGNQFKRIYFPTDWKDPELNRWEKRCDRICWIGRPLPERLKLAKQLRELRIPFDVYSKQSWGIREWKGYADDISVIGKKYKYQIVYENSLQDLYHSEKLMNSIMSGCVTFYQADYNLTLPIEGAYIRNSMQALFNREKLSGLIRNKMEQVLYGHDWEYCSFKSFYDTIINEYKRQLFSINRFCCVGGT